MIGEFFESFRCFLLQANICLSIFLQFQAFALLGEERRKSPFRGTYFGGCRERLR